MKTIIEWIAEAEQPAPVDTDILFLCNIGHERFLCNGQKSVRQGKTLWRDYSSRDRDCDPSEYSSGDVEYWAPLPEFQIEPNVT